MHTGRTLMRSVLMATVLAATGSLTADAAPRAAGPTVPSAAHTLKVGAASRSVLPRVNGSLDYLAAGFPSDFDAESPGVFVPAFDDGRIAVGNGDSEAHWVRDDLRVRAMAIDDPRSAHIVVIVSADLYMVFRTDADQIRAKVADRLPPGLAKRTEILVGATHNHHGPDTAFDVNHDWYDYMTDQAADAAVEAIRERKPATLRVAAGEHWFGMHDGTDPQIIDPRMNVLQAVGRGGDVVATVVQWNNHPEATLNWTPPVDLADDCAVLGWEGDDCHARGRYFTSDYAGALSRLIEREVGGEALYYVGALGVIIGPGGATIWEVDDDHPLGDHFTPPDGAAAPGGDGYSYTDHNFRRAIVLGEQAATAALRILDDAKLVTAPRVELERQEFITRLTNIGFRLLLVVDPATGRSQLGHEPAVLYNCPAEGPKTDETCTPDGFALEDDPLVGPIRAGDHLESEVAYLHIGSVGMMFLPGEVAGELTIGLPAEFYNDPVRWYDEPLGRHAFGDEYTTPGYVTNRMHDAYEFTIGLGSDELGYIFPISNWRIACVAGADACRALHDAGFIDHADAVSGTQCKAITEDPSLLSQYPSEVAQAIAASCRYGQAFGEAEGHYEETNGAGWDVAADMMAAVTALTGDANPAMVNPAFAGYWQKYPPPLG
jgi:hypothetical protein